MWPLNSLPKDRGINLLRLWNMINTLDGIHGFTLRLLSRGLRMAVEQVEILLRKVRKDVRNKKNHESYTSAGIGEWHSIHAVSACDVKATLPLMCPVEKFCLEGLQQ